jgi:hypothetical protein
LVRYWPPRLLLVPPSVRDCCTPFYSYYHGFFRWAWLVKS